MPDVFCRAAVEKTCCSYTEEPRLPIQVLSGRTTPALLSGSRGRVPSSLVGFGDGRIDQEYVRIVERDAFRGMSWCDTAAQLVRQGTTQLPSAGSEEPRFSRLSGRDGTVVWDIPMPLMAEPDKGNSRDTVFGDLDGDVERLGISFFSLPELNTPGLCLCGGGLLALRRTASSSGRANSRKSRRTPAGVFYFLDAGDLDRDGRRDVVVTYQPANEVVVEALEGREGRSRWAWHCSTKALEPRALPSMRVADLDGDGQHEVCLCVRQSEGAWHLTILDAQGRPRAARRLAGDNGQVLRIVDINGDGRDELLVHEDGRLLAFGAELKEIWQRRYGGNGLVDVVPGSTGQHDVLVLSPSIGVDGRVWAPGLGRHPRSIVWVEPVSHFSAQIAPYPATAPPSNHGHGYDHLPPGRAHRFAGSLHTNRRRSGTTGARPQ